ncbi:MerR family transcriptional regulator [Nocardia tengchongensis]
MPLPTTATEEAGYTVRTAAERLGIPTATLRSWNQRYGIGPRQDRPGRHRLYTEADLTQLTRMVELIRGGATPAAAAAATRGPALTLGDTGALLAAAFALDGRTVQALLETHFRDHGVATTWDRLCRPAFADIVARQLDGQGCVDVEHLLSWCIVSALHRGAPLPFEREPAPLVLACTSGEAHSLPLEVLRAALAERGVNPRMLGADVPTAALRDTLGRIAAPARIVLWSQHQSTARTESVRAGLEAGARVFVGGPGWDEQALPDTVGRLASLDDALEQLTAP